MLVEVKVPVLAESVPDATLLEWKKKSGERVERGENLIDLETDKVTLEVAAPEGGILVELRKQTGVDAGQGDETPHPSALDELLEIKPAAEPEADHDSAQKRHDADHVPSGKADH